VPASNLVLPPSNMDFAVAALAEPFSIAANMLERTGCGAWDTVLVYGAGPVGVTVLQVVKHLGARCMVADIDATRLNRAAGFGAEAVIDSSVASVPDAVKEETSGLGPTVVIDAAEVLALLEEACRIVSPAGRIGLLGFSQHPSALIQQEVVRKEVSIVGSRLNRRLLPEVVGWLSEGRMRPERMITQVFAAAAARSAFDLIGGEPEKTLKVQLDFAE